MKKLLLFILLVASFGLQAQTVRWVTNTNNAGVGSLRAAASNAVSGDIIRFNSSLIASGSDSIVLTTGEINFWAKGIIIKGLYTTTDTLRISGNNNSRIFSFNGAGRVVLDSLVLVNGNGFGHARTGYGGAILRFDCTDTLLVVNSMISGNSANHYGGGIYSYSSSSSSSLIINNSHIIDNKAFEGLGGGIYSASQYSVSFISVTNSNISENVASSVTNASPDSRGGGIYSASPLTSFISIVNSTIIGNTVSSAYTGTISSSCLSTGGGVYSTNGTFPLPITNYNVSSTISITNSSILRNRCIASSPYGRASSSGGGVRSSSYAVNNTTNSIHSFVTVLNSSISGNSVTSIGSSSNCLSRGGGIYSGVSNDSASNSVITITNSTIQGNISTSSSSNSSVGYSASSYGAGVYSSAFSSSTYNAANSLVDVTKSNITGNLASANSTRDDSWAQGGGIYSYGTSLSSISTEYSTFSGNSASVTYSGSADCYGGAISSFSTRSLISITKSTLSGNTAFPATFSRGGAVHVSSNSSIISVVNATISGNTASSGAGIYAYSSGTSSLNIMSSIVAENGNNSSGIYNSNSTTIISNGYNVFSGALTGTIASDSTHVTAQQLNLQGLAFNGSSTKTMMPGVGSIAIDNGNPLDTTDAQNVPILGVRERGAAEICHATYAVDSIVACNSYTWINGVTYYMNDTSAIYSMANSAGCDSLIQLRLEIHQSTYFVDSISTCNRYTWIDGNTYYLSNNTAQHVLTNSEGCDSIVILNLTITNTTLETYAVCTPFTWRNGITYVQSNYTAQDTVTVSGGCDSIFILNLTINTEYSTDVRSGCDSLTWMNGVTYYSNINTVKDTLTNRYGCDSIVTLDLTINTPVVAIDTVSACYFYRWSNGRYYVTDNNTATQTITGSNGCDSTVTLNLEVHIGTLGTDTQVACDSLVWIDGNTYYTNNTTATHTLSGGNIHGCDSIVTLNLTVNSTHTTDVITSCNPYTWIDGNTYTSSNNTATYSITNSLGCDSTVTLNFTRLISTVGTEIVSACGSYTWNGITYTSNNTTAQDTLVNAAGCDSIVTLNLTILNSTSFTDVITSCNQITWIDGNTYLANNNTATHILVNSVGCDSIVTLNLTVLSSTSFTDVVTSCDPITWIDGIIYNQTTSGQTFTIPNSQGCDSVVTLDFTLLEIDTTVTRNYLTLTAQASNASYQWIDCANGVITGETDASFTATVNGSYQVEITQNGCVDTSACFAIMNVGVEDMEENENVKVYPNPTSSKLFIETQNFKIVKLQISDNSGKVVKIINSNFDIVNVESLVTGIYHMELIGEKKTVTKKFIKQ